MSEYIYGTDDHEGHWLTGEEIVRCRDCVYYDKYPNDEIAVCYKFDNEQQIVEPDGYCAWGAHNKTGNVAKVANIATTKTNGIREVPQFESEEGMRD